MIAGSLNVYLNNAFQTYQGDDLRKEYVYGYQEMLTAEYWSADTQTYLKGYYNYKYILNASYSDDYIYDVEAVAVDKDDNVIKTFALTDEQKHAMFGQKDYHFTLLEKEIKVDGIGTYKFQDLWKYSFTDSSGNESGISYIGTDGNITINSMPDAKDKLTIKFKFDIEEVKYKRKIVAVDKNFNYIKDLTGEMEVTSGKTVSYQSGALESFKHNGVEYYYQQKWYFTYKDPNGNLVREPVGSGTYPGYVYKNPMPMAQKDSLAIFYMIYDTDSTVTPIPPTPTPTSPTPKPECPTPYPTVPPIVIPEPDSKTMPFTDVQSTGVLKADVRGTERFVSTLGVPTTESLYGEVSTREYLLGYDFVKKVGKKSYVVEVTRDYILKWYTATPESGGGPKLITEKITLTHQVTVPRAYGYWEIENLECYKISNAVLNNYALPGGSITIYPNYSYYSPPSVSLLHSDDEDYHILPPGEVVTGIQLEPITITASEGMEIHKPAIPAEDFKAEATYIALTQTGEAKVRSDRLIFNGRTVMNDSMTEKEAPDINISAIPQCYTNINQNVLYKPNNIIEATKENGIYPTTGTITYTKVAKVDSVKPDNPQYIINGLDKVIIHTPVVCIPAIVADNDRYVQLINPTQGCVQLVLDPDPNLSDFTVHISNTGFHSGKQGYFTRDFSKALRDTNLSYISLQNALLKNQVKFPFDVYIDTGAKNNSSDDDFIKAGTWITIDRSTPRFYLPMTVHEGVYRVDFRTIAVNGEPYLSNTEIRANTQWNNYVATDSMQVEVSGRVYGLTVYDISDYPMWEEVFRIPNSLNLKKNSSDYPDGTSQSTYSSGRSYTYTLGTSNQYGIDNGRNNKFTFPLVNGSHPKYMNQGILKTGYYIRFFLETTGDMYSDACMINIKPSFYYVDKDGKSRVAVDLYYTESINNKTNHLVKVGSALDQTNLKSYKTGDLSLGIPEWELKQTASLRNMSYGQIKAQYEAMFNFSELRLNWAFRTYTNNEYLNKMKVLKSYSDVLANGITEGDILERMQRWYGQYYLPNTVHVVEKGFNVMDYADKYGVDYDEDFWLKEGYIIVNFTIETVGENGSRRLSYINYSNYRDNNHCSMWLLEAPVISKTSYKGPIFHFYAGDFLIYYTDKKMSDDYNTGAIY